MSELVHGLVGGLVGDHDLMQLPDGRAADVAADADCVVDGVERRRVAHQVLGVLAGAGRQDRRGLEALLDEGFGLVFAQPVGCPR